MSGQLLTNVAPLDSLNLSDNLPAYRFVHAATLCSAQRQLNVVLRLPDARRAFQPAPIEIIPT